MPIRHMFDRSYLDPMFNRNLRLNAQFKVIVFDEGIDISKMITAVKKVVIERDQNAVTRRFQVDKKLWRRGG